MKPTQALAGVYRKLRLTTKDIKKGYYKGTGTGSMGRHTKRGGYVVEYHKVRTYVVPGGLDTFKLTPFVTKAMPRTFGEFGNQPDDKGPRSPTMYIARWKDQNGFD